MAGTITAQQLCEQALQGIAEGDRFNAFLETFDASAHHQAAQLDAQIAKGNVPPLAGAIVAIKDNLCLQNHRVGAASKILDGFVSTYTATAVQRLIDAGAIIIGRTNCDEFAMGSSNENSAYGPVRNPSNETLVAGGSSGGSAAAVAAGLCHAALGSDTGGSIRQPAAFCGVVGLKPTYGRVSRFGLIALASSLDQIGPLARTVEEAELIYRTLEGHDSFDSTSSTKPRSSVSQKTTFTFAYLEEVMTSPGLHPEVKKRFEERLDQLRAAGHQVMPASFPYLKQLVPCYYVLLTAEASSNLARYDGVHFGRRAANCRDLQEVYFKSRTEGFGAEVKRRIMLGTFVLSAGYYDAYYTKGQKMRRLIKQATESILASADFIVSPTTPHPAFKIGEKANDPIALYLEDIFTVQAPLAGNPSISIPMGKTAGDLPIGIQLTGRHFAEADLFRASLLIEQLNG